MDVIVSVWDNVSTELGLVHLEYQLSQDTVEVNKKGNKMRKTLLFWLLTG